MTTGAGAAAILSMAFWVVIFILMPLAPSRGSGSPSRARWETPGPGHCVQSEVAYWLADHGPVASHDVSVQVATWTSYRSSLSSLMMLDFALARL